MLLKQRRDGKIKVQTAAGGNKQRDCISKEDSRSPTAETEKTLPICIMYTKEEMEINSKKYSK